ncbi:50S RIBOSOMAL PROTEIN L31 [Mycoplasmopsis pulmonis]|uniref:Large ribosomal subunit protein bL31 n=1 Tax=Mycoplasmopsis pulmonis (strain UAB CTIP) TaxID=272635 RepID=RL31_MYCPU|nr:50S ribosomal protein L31 [Mycoplasmopsis pulmonis]Q98R70.1 RecName: Full=Large ribosomal subunit protein bL31; AltName: Full=50S ribosomal protein L31 [Mycoplasmopsis pulmonis UAB CTIP]MDZ7293109.1 50S ribosomal protein L31 [Mycoplasmopsis pulmonis]CAC13313.1 50S RIBOSOMAL PROTEIN L31 [Mycoplasmopsis pulmonis]VEU67904.1 50S ribosomal protein L31 [Mycoplasmopsis pulmonis]
MQKDIHLKMEPLKITCSTCFTSFDIVSSRKTIAIDICSKCHPFYTGDRTLAKATGQIDKFQKRLQKKQK